MLSKKNCLVIILVLNLTNIFPQEYSLKIWGFPIGEVSMDASQAGKVEFKTNSNGIIEFIWPFDNIYTTRYDTVNYGIREFDKRIKQGDFKQKLKGRWVSADSTFQYDDITLKRDPDIKNIFSFLIYIINQEIDQIDTKWFNIEHEGELFRVRLLWNESTELKIGSSLIPCDHYRLDIKAIDSNSSFLEQTDFFSKYIVHPEAVRQIWIASDNNKRIIRTSVKLKGLKIEANLKK